MISDLFKKNTTGNSNEKISIDDFLEDGVQIEIKNNEVQPITYEKKQIKSDNPLDFQGINPDFLMRDYESIKVLSMNPQDKRKIMDLISESKEDVQKLTRLLNSF